VVWSNIDTQAVEQSFFFCAVLTGAQCVRSRIQGTLFRQCTRGLPGYIFKIKGRHVNAFSEFPRRFAIVKPGLQKLAGGAGTGVCGRIQEQELKTQRNSGQAKHPAQLPATQYTNSCGPGIRPLG